MPTRIVLPHTRAQAAHAEDVTAALREEEPPLAVALNEAVCPSCALVFTVTDRLHSWGLCRDCLTEAVKRLPV